jgi:hypothetical protein
VALVGSFAAFVAYKYGVQNARDQQVKGTRYAILRHLSMVLQRMRQHFFDVDQASGRFGLVDEFFGTLGEAAYQQVTSLFNQKMAQVQEEIARLLEVSKLSDPDRNAKSEETQRQLAVWDVRA